MAGYTIAELPMEEISMGRSRADRAAIDSAVQRGQRPPGMAKKPGTPALDRISANMQARNAPKPKIGLMKQAGGVVKSAGGAATLAAVPWGVMKAAQVGGADVPDSAVDHPLEFIGTGLAQAYADKMPEFMGGLPKSTVDSARAAGISAFDGTRFDVNRPAIAKPAAQAAPTAVPPAATAQAEQAAAPGPAMPGSQHVPTIGKINVSRQPNGVMSFSGKDQVDGYSGPAAGQLKGGGSSGAVTPADYQAAIQRAEKDKAGVVSMAASYAAQGDREGAARMAAGDPAATAAAEQAFQQRELRIAALNGNNQAAAILNNQGDNETARLRIASDLAPKPETAYDQERTRGAKMDNDRAAITDGLLNQYMNAPDDKTRNTALERLNALGGKNSSDKYITIDVDTGQKDAMGNPIYAKAPFNTRTGQVASTSGAGQASAPANDEHAEGDYLRGSDGKAYKVVNGQPVLVQ